VIRLVPCTKDAPTYSWFEINKDGTGYIVLVVGLVEEHIFAISSFGRPFLEDAFFVYTVFSAQSLPVNRTHFGTISERTSRWLYAHFGCRIDLAGLLQSP
jgi:hypothetical protein